MILRSKIHLVAKEIWRLLEVYLFLVVSILGGQAIVKNTYLLSSKSKDKTVETRLLLSTKALLTYPIEVIPPVSQAPRHLPQHHKDGKVETGSEETSDSRIQASLSSHHTSQTPAFSASVPFLQSFAQFFQAQFASQIAYIPQRLKTPFNLIQINTPLLT